MASFWMYEAYIFDVDGTLLHTAPRILDCIRGALDEAGAAYDEAAITLSLIGPKIAEILDIVSPHLPAETKERIIQSFRRNYDNDPVPGTRLFPQMAAALQPLKQKGKKLFVATNKPLVPTMTLLKAFGLNGFSDVFCPDKYAGRKLSKAEMIAEILQANALDGARTVMVGDTAGDGAAARANGCAFAFADWGYAANKKDIALNADIILSEENYD